MVWNSLASCSSHLCAKELYEDIKKAYEDNLVDPFFIGLEDVDTHQSKGWEENLKSLKEDRHYQLIDDTIGCMEWWACFRHRKKKKAKPVPLKSLSTSTSTSTKTKTKTKVQSKKRKKKVRKKRWS